MNYKAFIFDLDGTLLNTLEDLKNSVNYAMNIMGCPEHSIENVRMFIGNGIPTLIKRALPADANETQLNKALAIFKSHYNQHMDDFTRAYDGVLESLQKIKAKGVKTGVVTNKNDSFAKELTKKHFGSLIDITLGYSDGMPPKPDPWSLNAVIEQLGVNKSEVLFFGDSDVDIITAKNASVACVGVTWGFRDKKALQNAGADIILDDPHKIFELNK